MFKKRMRRWFYALVLLLGSLAVGCCLFCLFFLPLWDDRSGLDIIGDMFRTRKDTFDTSLPVGDAPIGEDSFNNTDGLGWELLDNGNVIHAWNNFDSYYFSAENGIQFSNHWNEYWSTNVLMLGYYAGNIWNLIYRTDELSGFNRDFEGETNSFMNLTLWKDLNYGVYDFRLALRYHLGVNDSDLTIIPYIKNLGVAIPYVLGFGWEMKDIRIDNTYENDQIRINETTYLLNQTLDIKYTNITKTIYEYNETTNITTNYIIKNGEFYLLNSNYGSSNRYLYLRWNHTLDYRVWVKSRDGQYNAPITLFIRVGTLDVNQEKFTEMHWLDSSEILRPNAVGDEENLVGSGDNYLKVDDDPDPDGYSSYVYTSETNYARDLYNVDDSGVGAGAINYITVYAIAISAEYADQECLKLAVKSGDTVDESVEKTLTTSWVSYSNQWAKNPDTTNDWTWEEIDSLQIGLAMRDPKSGGGSHGFCTQVYVTVDYTAPPPSNNPPTSSGEAPTNSTDCVDWVGGGITTYAAVTDPDGDSMNVTWWSNSSGFWKQYGVANTSVSNNTNISQTNTNFSTDDTWYHWWMLGEDGMGGSFNDSYSFKICVNVSEDAVWTLTESWNFSFSNTSRIYHSTSMLWNFSFSNTSREYSSTDMLWNFSFSNTSRTYHSTDMLWNFSFSNTSRIYNPTDMYWNFSFSNTSQVHHLINSWNFSFSNTSREYSSTDMLWNFSFSNTSRTYHSTDMLWNFSFSNTSRTYHSTDMLWNFSFSNTTAIQKEWQLPYSWNFSFSNTSRNYNPTDMLWNFSFSNTSKIHHLVNSWNFSFSNTSREYSSTDMLWNFSFSNTSRPSHLIISWNFSFSNTTEIRKITISNIYPSNNSNNIALQPYLYATFNSTIGNTLNITWYYNNSALGIESNVNNGTYNELLFEAITRATNYTWTVKVNDSEGNWLNSSYNFKTEGYLGVKTPNNNLAIVAIGLGIFGMLAFIFVRRRKRE